MTRGTTRKLTDRRRNLGIGLLKVEDLRVDAAIQQRVALDSDTVEAYTEAFRRGAKFPPLVAFEDPDDPGAGCWLADGFHRYAAYVAAGCLRTAYEVDVELRRGTRRDAILFSVGANAEHGLPRSPADKRRAVRLLLEDAEWSTWSDRAIAEAAKVSHPFVAKVRAELAESTGNVSSGPRTGRDGRTIDTSGIEEANRARAPEPVDPGPLLRCRRCGFETRDPLKLRNGLCPDCSPTTVEASTEPVEARQLALPPLPDRCGVLHPVHDLPCTEAVGHTGWAHTYMDGPDRIFWPVSSAGARSDDSPRPRASSPVVAGDDDPAPDRTGQVDPLPDDERAPLDGYYTPLATARACVRWLLEHVLSGPFAPGSHGGEGGRQWAPHSAVEPSVGGGSWVQAVHELLPGWTIDRVDINPEAPGILLERIPKEDALVADWLAPIKGHTLRRHHWRLCLGNRPYSGEHGELGPWVERCLERAPVVALLERETITGTEGRRPWWLAHRPDHIVKVVPRPIWEGPGARDNSDFADTVLIVWNRYSIAAGDSQTFFHWLGTTEGS